jgi:Polyketide cyclase / dehydrase and lipid transport
MWYTMIAPVTVSIDIPQPRADVYAFLDVMANHESFTDHMLVDWSCSGPESGVGSRATVTAKFGGMSDKAEIEVIEVEEGRLIRERNIAAKGRRVATGTYVLSDLPDGGTHVEFTFAFERVPGYERPLVPLMRKLLRRGNERAMTRLAEQLRSVTAGV